MSIDERELELQTLRALRNEPNTIERKYMALYDEKTRLGFVVQEYERQITNLDKNILSYRKKHNDAKSEISRLEKVTAAYEGKLQQTAQAFESLNQKYRDAVTRYQECDERRRETELENIELKEQLEEARRDLEELQQMNNTAFMAGQELQQKYDHVMEVNHYLESENASLKDENTKFRGQVANDKRNMFGSKSEQTENLFNGQPVQENPTAEDAQAEEAVQESLENQENGGQDGENVIDFKDKRTSAKTATEELNKRLNRGGTPLRNGGNKKYDAFKKFAHLEQRYTFERDEEKEADPRFRFMRFEDHWDLRETRPTNYVMHTLTPVYEEKMEDGFTRLVSVPLRLNLWPGSYVSSSIFARLVTEKFVRGVTTYSMEEEYKRRGVLLTRKTINRWFDHFAETVFKAMCEHLGVEMDERFFVQQMDETWLTQVLWSVEDKLNGKKNGAKGILWERIAGELSDGPKIVLFTYSKTRSVEFLKKVLENYAGYLVSDAYIAYFAMEKLNEKMRVAICWMHCRRCFAVAMIVSSRVLKMWDGKTEEEILEQPAVKALMISNRIFEADTELKGLSVEERYEERLKKVAPIVDEFFEYVESIDLSGDDMFEDLRKAIGYAKNQKEHLKVFLKDGEIPIDNGHCERQIKHVAKVRKSCLFAYSESGANAFGWIMSIIWTAIGNGADPFYYVKFLLEEWAKLEQQAVPDMKEWLAKRTPWETMYKEYERRQKASHADEFVPESEAPREGERVRCKGDPPDEWQKPPNKECAA